MVGQGVLLLGGFDAIGDDDLTNRGRGGVGGRGGAVAHRADERQRRLALGEIVAAVVAGRLMRRFWNLRSSARFSTRMARLNPVPASGWKVIFRKVTNAALERRAM